MPKKKALAVQKPTPAALSQAPSYLKAGAVRGREAVKAEDLKIPFLRLSQDKTPLVVEGKLHAGRYFNNLTKKDYGESMQIIPILLYKGRMRFEDFDEGGGMLCQSNDCLRATMDGGLDGNKKPTTECAKCVFAEWTKKKDGSSKPPECSEQGRILVLVPGEKSPALLVLQNTSFPAYRELASILSQKAQDTFASVLTLTVSKGKKSLVVSVADSGQFASEADYRVAEGIYEAMKDSFFKKTVVEQTEK